MVTVGQILKVKGDDVWSVSPDANVYEALRQMADRDIGALLVMDGEQLVGIFSERDYARKIVLFGKSSMNTPVHEVMTKDAALTVKDLAIGGRELMALGLTPGPGFGRILRALLEEVLDDPTVNTPETLTARARELIAAGVPLEPDAHERRERLERE